MRRIGILGGTFNPPHLGHLHMAKAALEEGGLDEVIWIPNGDPPHKIPDVSSADRFRMTELCVEEETRMSVSDIEVSRTGRSYMADTLEELMEQYPGTGFSLICGEDMLVGLSSWYRAADIFRMAEIMVFRRAEDKSVTSESLFMPRLEDTVTFLRRQGACVTMMKTKIPAVSSTEIRMAAAGAAALQDLVPVKVADYILEHGLYRQKENL